MLKKNKIFKFKERFCKTLVRSVDKMLYLGLGVSLHSDNVNEVTNPFPFLQAFLTQIVIT